MIQTKELNAATNIVSGSQLNLELERDTTYRALNLEFLLDGNPVDTAWLKTNIEKMNLKVTHASQGVKSIIDGISGEDWFAILDYQKRHYEDGILNIPFDRPQQMLESFQDMTLFGTASSSVTHVVLLIDLKAGISGTITLRATAEYVPGDNRAMGAMMFYDIFTHGAVVNSKVTIPSIPKGEYEGVLNCLLAKDEGKIKLAKFKKNGNTVLEHLSRKIAYQSIQRHGKRTVQDGYLPFDFEGPLSRGGDGLNMEDARTIALYVETSESIPVLDFVRIRTGMASINA